LEYVRSWSKTTIETGTITGFTSDAVYATQVTNYLNYVSTEYDGAPVKMKIIGREYWLSLFGNGTEAFNLYRRTGQPSNMQPGLEVNSGVFPRSFFYPLNYLVTNTNAVQKADQSVQVFWDNNPAGNAWVY
jgi:hypothetical protein